MRPGLAGRGMVWCVKAGTVMQGGVRCVAVRFGKAGLGWSWLVKARLSIDSVWRGRLGAARHVLVCSGQAGQGRSGEARRGAAR